MPVVVEADIFYRLDRSYFDPGFNLHRPNHFLLFFRAKSGLCPKILSLYKRKAFPNVEQVQRQRPY